MDLAGNSALQWTGKILHHKAVNAPPRGGYAAIRCHAEAEFNRLPDHVWSGVRHDTYVAARIATPRHAAGQRVTAAVTNRRVVAAADETAADGSIGDVGERSAVDVRRGNFQHGPIIEVARITFQIEGMAEEHPHRSGRNKNARCIEDLVAGDSRVIDNGTVRRAEGRGRGGNPKRRGSRNIRRHPACRQRGCDNLIESLEEFGAKRSPRSRCSGRDLPCAAAMGGDAENVEGIIELYLETLRIGQAGPKASPGCSSVGANIDAVLRSYI